MLVASVMSPLLLQFHAQSTGRRVARWPNCGCGASWLGTSAGSQAFCVQFGAPWSKSVILPTCVGSLPLVGRAMICVPDPDASIVGWLLEQLLPVPSESMLMLPGIAGSGGTAEAFRPTLTWEPPEALRAVQPVGSSSQSEGMFWPGVVKARITAEACVVRTNSLTTPEKKLLRVFAT